MASVKMVSLPCGSLKILEMLAAVKWMIRPSMLPWIYFPRPTCARTAWSSRYLEAPMGSKENPINLLPSDSSDFSLSPTKKCGLSF